MITIATLSEATEQEVFDQVANHLLTQGVKSMKDYNNTGVLACAYRGENNTKCAAGCLIGDNEYKREMEGRLWGGETSHGRFIVPEKHHNLIRDLQSIHDSSEPADWSKGLIDLARDKGLNALVID